jgi:hypothetical protein
MQARDLPLAVMLGWPRQLVRTTNVIPGPIGPETPSWQHQEPAVQPAVVPVLVSLQQLPKVLPRRRSLGPALPRAKQRLRASRPAERQRVECLPGDSGNSALRPMDAVEELCEANSGFRQLMCGENSTLLVIVAW